MLTIRTVLSSLIALDLPCFDLVVAGNPQPTVLCSEVGTIRSLSNKSAIWESLFSLLEKEVQKSDLASAIHVAFNLKRLRSKDYTRFMFVLTDGLFEKSERNKILHAVNNCVQGGTNVFGIGLGAYPKGIEELFPQVVFAPNPSLVMKCIASFFGDTMSGRMEEMSPTLCYNPNFKDVEDVFNTLIKNENNPIYRGLKNELCNIKSLLDAHRHYLNKEGDTGNAIKGFTNFDEPMYPKDIFKSQKILIVMLYDYTMNPRGKEGEREELQVQYVFENFDKSKNECIKTAVDYFGITVEVVRNYNDAISKLTDQTTRPGFCDYYAVWVICGPPIGELPDKSKYPNLVGQFVDVLIQFWHNGGALVFWAEGGGLYYQVNLFLEKMKFGFKIDGNNPGTKVLLPDTTGDLSQIQTFNRNPQGNKKTERPKLSHNLGRIFEGVTIACAPYDLKKLERFIPFARDSSGGVSSLFLPSDGIEGDIIIDCGYTKCFANLEEDGTFRYIQNIAGWTMRNEIRSLNNGFNPRNWRPKAIEHKINLSETWKFPTIQVQGRSEVDMIFCIDATGSMSSWLQAAKQRARDIANSAISRYKDKSFRFGVIFFRDPFNNNSNHDYHQLTSNINELVQWMNGQNVHGGGGAEDWVGAYEIVDKEISWRPGACKAIIHIADNPAHGSDWGGRGDNEQRNDLLYPLIRKCAKEKIYFSGINIKSGALESFKRIEQIYKEEGVGDLIEYQHIDHVDANRAGDFISKISGDLITKIFSAFY
jgi:hypothetical protein